VIVGVALAPWSRLTAVVVDKFDRNGDHADAIGDEAAAIYHEIESVMDSFRKGKACDAATAEMDALLRRIDDLYLRAVRIDSIPDERTRAVEKRISDVIAHIKGEIAGMQGEQRGAPAGQAAPLAPCGPLRTSLYATGERFIALMGALQVWKTPPGPQDAGDKTELAMLALQRDSLIELSRADSPEAVEKAAAALDKNAARMKELGEQLERDRATVAAGTPYGRGSIERLRTELDRALSQVQEILDRRYEKSTSLSRAVHDLRKAGYRSSEHAAGGEGELPFVAASVDADSPLAHMIRAHGSANVLAVGCEWSLDGTALQKITEPLNAIIGKPPEQTMQMIGTILIYITDADVQKIADQIDFVKVKSVDVPHRRITLDVSRRELQDPSDPSIPLAGHPPGPMRRPLLVPGSESKRTIIANPSPETIIESMARQFGREKIVVIVFPDKVLAVRTTTRIAMQLSKLAQERGRPSYVRRWSPQDGSGTFFVVPLQGDVNEIAAALTFAKVRSVDGAARRIEMEPPAESPEEQADSKRMEELLRRARQPAPQGPPDLPRELPERSQP